MDALLQRLKELDRDKFEGLIFQLLCERYPGAGIHRVDGAGGDEGVDTFMGNLANGSTVWQAKSFPNGIRAVQRRNIRKSLQRVLEARHPDRWVLCTSIDFDIKGHKWFEELKAKYRGTVEIEHWLASPIALEVLHRKTIRDYYFPDLGVNVAEIRALIMKTGAYTDEELQGLTVENAYQYIDRLERGDARFRYELVVSPEQAPKPSPASWFSVQNGSILINAYPRDVKALRDDPVHVQVRLKDTGVEKFQEFLRTGRETNFTMDELVSAHSTLGLPGLSEQVQPLSFQLGNRSGIKPMPYRVTFGVHPHEVVYNHVALRIASVGTEELHLTSEGRLPFTLHFVLRDKVGHFTIEESLPGAPIGAVKKYSDALLALRDGGQIELYDLDEDRVLGRFQNNGDVVPILDEWMLRLVTDMARVAIAYGAPLVLPESLSREDEWNLQWLVCLLDGTMPSLGEVTTEVLLDESLRSWVAMVVAGDGSPIFKLANAGITVPFAGVSIQTGPYEVFLDRVRFENPEQTLQAAQTTPVDAPLKLTIIPITTPRAQRLTGPQSVPPPATA